MKEYKFVYELCPIDFWDGWIPLPFAMSEPFRYGISVYDGDEESARTKLQDKFEEAKFLIAKHTSWEGDGSVYITTMPGSDDGGGQSHLVFAIKQGNNGTTYIVAPFEYIHLRGSLVKTVTINISRPAVTSTVSDGDLPF